MLIKFYYSLKKTFKMLEVPPGQGKDQMPCFQFITPNINTWHSQCSVSADCLNTNGTDARPWAFASEVNLMTMAKRDAWFD